MTEKNQVGLKIRQLREMRQCSLEDLAEQSGCSAAFIEQLEAGELAPSLAPLLKIARGLGVRLGTFLDDSPQNGPVVARSGVDCQVVRFSGQSHSNISTLDFHALAADKKDRHMEPFLIDVHPSAEEECNLSTHEGEEFIYVLSGSIQVVYGNETHVLQMGDSIYYDSVVPHEVHATNESDMAKILAVVYTPV